MTPAYVSDAEFWRLHEANRKTPRYRAQRLAKIERQKGRCCVCRYRYLEKGYTKWDLQMDHVRYRDESGLIFGRETLADFRLCCPDDHEKGVRDGNDIAELRAVRRWQWGLEGLLWLTRKGLRLSWQAMCWLAKRAWRLLRGRPSARR